MIPDHLIDKAAEASLGMPLSAMHHEDAEYARETARLALEAVAADIWAEGFDAGERDAWEHEHGSYDDPCIPNPYKRNEHA